MDLNKIANEGYHKIAQIEGTEDLLRDYFSEISNPNDTLYVFLCPLMFAPRMDGIMPIVQEMLYCKNPNNSMVLIASFQNKDAAKKYVENKFFFEDVIYDTDKSYKSFLAFSTEDPRVPLLMKIDRKSGRLLTGGDWNKISPDFINAFVNHTEPMPFYSEVWSEKINFNHSTSECENESFKKAEVFRKIIIPLDEDTFISIEGKIDRIDKFGDYIRIIDYKTGKTDSDMGSIYYGKKIQLVSYLMASEKIGNKKIAGLFYFPIHSDFVKIQQKTKNNYKMQGFLLDDIDVIKYMDCGLSLDNPESELIAPNEYTFAIAVLLSAQTTDKAVNKVTPNLWKKYPEIEDLATANLSDVEDCLRAIGLYKNKAKNIILLAKKLVEMNDGKVIPDYDGYLKNTNQKESSDIYLACEVIEND